MKRTDALSKLKPFESHLRERLGETDLQENANRLSDGLKGRHPDLPWSAMYAFRNIVSHEYHVVDPERSWAATEA